MARRVNAPFKKYLPVSCLHHKRKRVAKEREGDGLNVERADGERVVILDLHRQPGDGGRASYALDTWEGGQLNDRRQEERI